MTISFYCGGINKTIPKRTISVEDIFYLIKSDYYKNQVLRIREFPNKADRKILKDKLDYVTFSGVFSKRGNENMISPSGFLCLDYDAVTNINTEFQNLKNNKYVHMIFKSPSGNGFKVVVKIPPTKDNEEFKRRYDAITKEFGASESLDPTSRDIARACFLSYDPDAYYNPNSEVFEGIESGVLPRKWGANNPKKSDININVVKMVLDYYDIPIKNGFIKCFDKEHDDKNPSMRAYDDGHFWCFTKCFKRQDLKDLIRIKEDVGLTLAGEMLDVFKKEAEKGGAE